MCCLWQHRCAVVKGLSGLLLQGFILSIVQLWDINFLQTKSASKISPEEFLLIENESVKRDFFFFQCCQRWFFFFSVKNIKTLNLNCNILSDIHILHEAVDMRFAKLFLSELSPAQPVYCFPPGDMLYKLRTWWQVLPQRNLNKGSANITVLKWGHMSLKTE